MNLRLLKAYPRGKVSGEPIRYGSSDVQVTDVSYGKNERIFYVWVHAARMPPTLQVGLGVLEDDGTDHTIGRTGEFQTDMVDASETEVWSAFDLPPDFALHGQTTYLVYLRDCEGPCGKAATAYTVVFPTAGP